jgi:membrane protein
MTAPAKREILVDSPFAAMRERFRPAMAVLGRVIAVLESWSSDRCSTMSAALGFYAAFSIAPMLVVVIAVAGFFFGEEAVQGRLFSEIQALVGKEGAVAVQAMVASAWRTQATGWIGLLSLAGVIIGASATFSELTSALNWIWRAPRKTGPVAALIRVRLLSFGLVLGTGFLLIVLLVTDAFLAYAGQAFFARRGSIAQPLLSALQHGFTLAFLSAAFAVLLKVLPNVPVRWRDAGLGALAAALLFSAGKHLLALYLARSGTANAFGATGSLAVIMIWLFFSAAVFLLGAEVAAHALPGSRNPRGQ